MNRFKTLLAALAVALALAAPANASESSPDDLLARYQPVTVLDRFEAFAPVAIDGFLVDSALEARQPDGTYAETGWTPDNRPGLPVRDPSDCTSSPGAPCLRLNQRACSPNGPVGSLACYAAANAAGGAPSTVYGRYDVRAGTIVLQYWFFYYDNVWSLFYPANDVVWQAHEGDWEAVTIVLDENEQPIEAAYSRHCSGARRAWSDVPKVPGTEHPLVFVATGSHANYFGPGIHPIDLRCYPREAVEFFRARRVTPLDFVSPSRQLGPGAPGIEPTAVERIHDNAPRWVRFPGRWGQEQYVHAPAPIGTVAFGYAPDGPKFHDVWIDPLGTIAEYPAG